MVLAHQYLGQLDPKLQEAFAGGVSARDACTLVPMLYFEPGLIEAQPKGSFAAYVRDVTKSALPLIFPFGHMEAMERMSRDEADALREAIHERYAVHYSEIGPISKENGSNATADDTRSDRPTDPDNLDTGAASEWQSSDDR
ncbi:MAG: hypothetical protein ACI8S3_001435 [Alphaproteobacteria bacterium]|jgi:hypothetical protein